MAQIPLTNSAPAQQAPQQQGFPQKKREFPVIPDETIVNAEVVAVELRDLNPEFRAKYKIKETQEVSFRFRVTDGEYKGLNVWGNAKPIFDSSPECRLRIWTQEILGMDSLPEGFVFDTEDLAGLNTRILVTKYSKRDGSEGNRVKDVLRSNSPATALYDEEPF